METKRFIGNDMPRLYERVRKEFGPDAIIVRTRSLLRDGAEPLIELVAAAPPAEPELALDLQWKMVDGALGRLQIARPRPTIGDLEDMAAREAMAPDYPRLPAPAESWQEPDPQSFEAASTYYEEDEPVDSRPFDRVDQQALHDIFSAIEDLPDAEPPSNAWASRPRPVMRVRHQEPDPEPIDFTQARAPQPPSDPVAVELLAAGLSSVAVARIQRDAPHEADPARALAATLASFDVRYPDERETAIVTIQGPAGAGRTTALMRMALDCADSGREAILVSADTTRAGARDQLYAYGDATELPVFDAPDGAALAGLMRRARRGACLFVDVPAGPFTPPQTAGDQHYTYLALPAHWQLPVLERELRAYPLAQFSGCVFTAADVATDLSPVLSLAVVTGMGVAFLSSGRDISTGIETADPLRLASGILRVTSGETTDGRLVASA